MRQRRAYTWLQASSVRKIGHDADLRRGRHGASGHRHQGGALRRRPGEERADATATKRCSWASSRRRPAKVRKPLAGHYKKAGVPPTRVRREVGDCGGRRCPEGRRSGARQYFRRRRARGHCRHRPRQGVSRRCPSAIISRAAPRRTGRCSIARPARLARRRFRRAWSRACAPRGGWAAAA